MKAGATDVIKIPIECAIKKTGITRLTAFYFCLV